MIGMIVTIEGTTGTIDAERGTPDGKLMVRINDKWFMAEQITAGS